MKSNFQTAAAQEGIQLPSGKLVLPSPLASGVGGVTYYEDGQAAGRQQLRLACHEARAVLLLSVDFVVYGFGFCMSSVSVPWQAALLDLAGSA